MDGEVARPRQPQPESEHPLRRYSTGAVLFGLIPSGTQLVVFRSPCLRTKLAGRLRRLQKQRCRTSTDASAKPHLG
jgi:hypothetical protein